MASASGQPCGGEKPVNVLVACSGSVASIKLLPLLESLKKINHTVNIRVVLTESAKHFIDLSKLSSYDIFDDSKEWSMWTSMGDPVLHIELKKWADIMVIAPLSANSLAKLTVGICDNLLTCIVRAWDMSKPLLFAPAMNTHMWYHPVTAENITKLKSWGYIEVPCVAKTLACGDKGLGAMAEVQTIAAAVEEQLNKMAAITSST